MRYLVSVSALVLLLLACDDTLDPAAITVVRVVSGGGTDTIDVLDTLVVETRRFGGIPAPGVEVVFRAVDSGGGGPTVLFLRSSCCFGGVVHDTTDRDGRVSIGVIHGPTAGNGMVVVTVLGEEKADTARFATTAGAPVASQVFPRDRPIMVDSAYLLGARLVDRHLNTVLSSVTFSTVSTDISVSPAGIVRGLAIGRAKIAIQLAAFSDSAFTSVVPQATLAVRDYSGFVGDSTGYAQMNLDGSGYRRLFNTDILPSSYGPSNTLAPQWIPGTGKLVHLRAVGGVTRLFVSDSGASALRLIGSPGSITGESDPDVSADGAWVYFVGHSDSGDAIWRVATTGGVPERLTPVTPGLQLHSPSISPDGTHLVYTVAPSGIFFRAYVRDLTTGDTTRLSDNQAAGTLWSPAGDWIVYAASYPYAGYSGPLHLVRPDGTEDHELSGDPYFWGGSWSPDGSYVLVMRAAAPGHAELINVETGLRLPLIYDRTWYGPAWRH